MIRLDFFIQYFLLIIVVFVVLINAKSYDTGLIFYNAETRQKLLPPSITSVLFKTSTKPLIGQPCSCKGAKCKCCAGIKIDRFNFDQKMCTRLSFDSSNLEVKMEMDVNDRNIVMYTFAANNPPPFCVPIPLPVPVSLCVKLHSLGYTNNRFHVCMDWIVQILNYNVYTLHFRCFNIGENGVEVLPPEEVNEDQEDSVIIQEGINGDVYDPVDLDRSMENRKKKIAQNNTVMVLQ